MALLKEWYAVAYDEKANKGDIQRFWTRYFELEKGVYEQLLTNPDEEVKGSVKELAEKYNLSTLLRELLPQVPLCSSTDSDSITFHSPSSIRTATLILPTELSDGNL